MDIDTAMDIDTKPEHAIPVIPYVAPEVLHTKKHTCEADIYSLGVVLYEITTGLNPYHNTLHDILELSNSTPKLISQIISRCWDAEPSRRPSIEELYDQLIQLHFAIEGNEKPTVVFTIPTVQNINLNNGRRAPKTCFILFRNAMLDCVTALNLRIERQDLSKHATNLWHQLKTQDIQLVDEFKRVAHIVAQQCYSEIKTINVNIPVAEIKTINANIPVAVHAHPPIPPSIDDNDNEGLQELLEDVFAEVLPPPFLHD
ncbi:28379_t:CDS:2 [Dentiscutata erythropus]|uniref:28379_t:CDS:1 n=1 Tax=Dentiscutata erythropus TaxID=1348616 RepID=A0A9N9G7B3_9GLOM|nr:28379_t:CDS:2 [Dentiscutata erythropus]